MYCISVPLSTYLHVCLYLHICMFAYIYVPTCLYVCLSMYEHVCMLAYLCTYMFVCLPIYVSTCLAYVYLCSCLLSLFVCLSACHIISTCPYVCLFVVSHPFDPVLLRLVPHLPHLECDDIVLLPLAQSFQQQSKLSKIGGKKHHHSSSVTSSVTSSLRKRIICQLIMIAIINMRPLTSLLSSLPSSATLPFSSSF